MTGKFFRCILIAAALFNLISCGSDNNNYPLSVNEFNNVAVLSNSTVKQLEEIVYYKLNLNNKTFINNVVLFAANINSLDAYNRCDPAYPGNDPNKPCIYYNEYIDNIINTPLGLDTVRKLQNNGIKVHMAFLGNHDTAGWSCIMNDATIASFSKQMVDVVVNYKLDGIMIDDEYSKCSGDTMSFYNLVKAIKNNPGFSGKVLSKALFLDDYYFTGQTNVASFLDQGYDMHYGENISVLKDYVSYGMAKQSLGMGVWYTNNPTNKVRKIAFDTISNGYGGIMIFAPHLIPTYLETANYFTEIAKGEYGDNATVDFNYSTAKEK